MREFQSNLSDSASAGLQDAMSKIANGLQPSAASQGGQTVLGGTIAYNTATFASTATISVNALQSNFISYTVPGVTSVVATSAPIGEPLVLQFYQGTSGVSATITFGTNFKTTGILNTGTNAGGKAAIMQFISDGLNFYESSRTVFM